MATDFLRFILPDSQGRLALERGPGQSPGVSRPESPGVSHPESPGASHPESPGSHFSVSMKALMRSMAFWICSLEEAALQRMCPSPRAPKAVPGTAATRWP